MKAISYNPMPYHPSAPLIPLTERTQPTQPSLDKLKMVLNSQFSSDQRRQKLEDENCHLEKLLNDTSGKETT